MAGAKRSGEVSKNQKVKSSKLIAATKPATKGTVLFRHLGDQVGPTSTAGYWWQVEYYTDRWFPEGIAWVCDPPGGGRPGVHYVQVADDARRRGVATRLVAACLEQWPGADLSPPISKAGLALSRKFIRLTPEDVYTPRVIRNFLAKGWTRDDLQELVDTQEEDDASGDGWGESTAFDRIARRVARRAAGNKTDSRAKKPSA